MNGPPSDEVRIGIIGHGRWGPKLARALLAAGGARVVAIAVRSEASAAALRHRVDATVTTDAVGLVASDTVDAVVIATPAPSHGGLARAALQAGKHVLVEKPMATSSPEVVELVGLAERSRLVLGAGHVYLHHPAITALAGLQSAGRLGRIRQIRAAWLNPTPAPADETVLWNLGPHPVSIAVRLLGDAVAWVEAAGTHPARWEDAVNIRLGYRSGEVVEIALDWRAAAKVRTATVVGTDARATFDDRAEASLLLASPAGAAPAAVGVGDGSPLDREAAAFLRAVRGGHFGPMAGGEDVAVVRLLEAAARSAASHGARVDPSEAPPAPAQPDSSAA